MKNNKRIYIFKWIGGCIVLPSCSTSSEDAWKWAEEHLGEGLGSEETRSFVHSHGAVHAYEKVQ